MKPIIQKLWMVMAILWMSAPMFAYDFTYNGLIYKWISGDYVRLHGISSLPDDGKLVVPEKVYDYGELQYVDGISDMRYGKNLKLLKSIVINDNVDYIDPFALTRCENLTRIEYNVRNCGFFATIRVTDDDSPFPSTITEAIIGNNVEYVPKAFLSRDIALHEIKIPNSVKTIGGFAFKECTNLKKVEIGESISSIGRDCFAGASNMQSITILAQIPPSLHSDAVFDNQIYQECALFVPKESISLYKEAAGWKNFYHIYSIGEIPIENITLNLSDIKLYIGEQVKLTAHVEPASSTIPNITWSSDNEAVATVGLDGTVTALAVGNATITASSTNGLKATCEVTVFKTSTDIDGVISDENTTSVVTKEGSIHILNKRPEAIARVYTIQGNMIAETTDNVICNLQSGLYILTVGPKSFKVSVR